MRGEEVAMKIQWIGHACFAITGRYGTVVVTDPYEPGGFGGALAYGPVPVKADIVTVSHEHGDHGYVQGVRESPPWSKSAAPRKLKVSRSICILSSTTARTEPNEARTRSSVS